MPVGDIRQIKKDLRLRIKAYRRSLDAADKQQLDLRVFRTVTRLHQYQRARTVLCYLSTPIEVETHSIIEDALSRGKRVALPRCVEGTRLMEFYLIHSFDDLETGSYGLLEPKQTCEQLHDFSHSVCLIPGLAFDRMGYRLGYGGGYYDRFLSGYRCPKIGIIYSQNLMASLPHGHFDRTADLIASDTGFFYTHAHRRVQKHKTHQLTHGKEGKSEHGR